MPLTCLHRSCHREEEAIKCHVLQVISPQGGQAGTVGSCSLPGVEGQFTLGGGGAGQETTEK